MGPEENEEQAPTSCLTPERSRAAAVLERSVRWVSSLGVRMVKLARVMLVWSNRSWMLPVYCVRQTVQ